MYGFSELLDNNSQIISGLSDQFEVEVDTETFGDSSCSEEADQDTEVSRGSGDRPGEKLSRLRETQVMSGSLRENKLSRLWETQIRSGRL